jgi:hypothetical protein
MGTFDNSKRRERDPNGRRTPVTLNLSPETHNHLTTIGDGNKSRAVERLVEAEVKRLRRRAPVVA